MVEVGKSQQPLEEKIIRVLGILQQNWSQDPGEVLRICQEQVPEMTEDARLLVVHAPKIFTGYWQKTYSRLVPSMLLRLDEVNRPGVATSDTLALVDEIKGKYLDSKDRYKKVLFDSVFRVVREYHRQRIPVQQSEEPIIND